MLFSMESHFEANNAEVQGGEMTRLRSQRYQVGKLGVKYTSAGYKSSKLGGLERRGFGED